MAAVWAPRSVYGPPDRHHGWWPSFSVCVILGDGVTTRSRDISKHQSTCVLTVKAWAKPEPDRGLEACSPVKFLKNQMRLYAFSCILRNIEKPLDGYILMKVVNRVHLITSNAGRPNEEIG